MPAGYIIAEEQYLGEYTFRGPRRFNTDGDSSAYFCRQCGEVWARRILLDSEGQPLPFRVYYSVCRNHVDDWTISGALTTDTFNPELQNLSEEFIRREFEVLLTYYEKII